MTVVASHENPTAISIVRAAHWVEATDEDGNVLHEVHFGDVMDLR